MHISSTAKNIAWGVGGTMLSLWLLTRLLPGAAARLGLFSYPLFGDSQRDLYEPFGLRSITAGIAKAAVTTEKASSPVGAPSGGFFGYDLNPFD